MLNIFEWVLINGDKLADTIKREGTMSGPESDKMLTEAQQCDATGRLKDRARKLLKDKLTARGIGHIMGG